jgi:ubiquinol-cytochrome c reductase cytochrome c1 subunit
MRNSVVAVVVLGLAQCLQGASAAEERAAPVDWQLWGAGNNVANIDSLQRGARNFVNYCSGCHSMKYVRYSRMAKDLKIPTEQLKSYLLPADTTPADYFQASIAPLDAVAWFGKEPPDLSLIARSRGPDKVYRFLKTFYLDPSRPTGTNNLVLNNPAMPPVLSDLEGVKAAVFTGNKQFDHFVTVTPGRLTPVEFDAFVRDTVNFLDYAGEPAQGDRRAIGVWVVLFLLTFTWMAWLLKKEYWKDVH